MSLDAAFRPAARFGRQPIPTKRFLYLIASDNGDWPRADARGRERHQVMGDGGQSHGGGLSFG
jgi:hypothetical protein